MKIKGDDRIALVGATGSGKTFLARKLLSAMPRLVVFDPKATLRGKWGLTEWSKKSVRTLERGDPIRVRFSPRPGEEYRYEQILSILYDIGSCFIYIDEVYGIVSPGKQPERYLSAVYTRGREKGLGVMAGTQRPSWIPLFILSEANWFIAFRLMLDKDRRRMAEFMGPSVMRQIDDPYGFFLFSTYWKGEHARYFTRLT